MNSNYQNHIPYGVPYHSPPNQENWVNRQIPVQQMHDINQLPASPLPPVINNRQTSFQPGLYNSPSFAQPYQTPDYRQMPVQQNYMPHVSSQMMPNQPPQQTRKKSFFRKGKNNMNEVQGFQTPTGTEQPQKEKAGLFSKISNKKNRNAPPPSLFSLPSGSIKSSREAASAAASNKGGFLQNLASTGSITSMLGNTQKFLQAAEAFGPVVQQYGPYLKKLPSILNFAKENESNEAIAPSSAQIEKQPQNEVATRHPVVEKKLPTPVSEVRPRKIQPKPTEEAPEAQQNSNIYMVGESRPKLFI